MSTAIELREVALDVVFPRAAIPMVLMQPLVEMALDRQPYCWLPAKVVPQCDAVHRTLAIASVQRACFTVFPEYSLHGLEGVRVVHQAVCSDSWHANSVVIAGVDGLGRDTYKTVWDLLRPSDPISGSEPQHVSTYQWVNCCVVWVKEASGSVRAFVQPKLTRAWLEQQVRFGAMRTGQGVYVFRGGYEPDSYPCRFLCLICFDWIGEDGGQSALGRVLAGLNARWQEAGTPNPLHWIFVPQCNDKPCHSLFLTATSEFFLSGNHPFVERRDGVVVHANCASPSRRARVGSFGFSSVVFHPDTFDCTGDRPATVCYAPKRLRQSEILMRCQDVVFREMGPCIHSMRVRVPKYARHDAAGRAPPVDMPSVHPLSPVEDARAPAGPVPASVKWLLDCLDELRSLDDGSAASPLMPAAVTRQQEVIDAWRCLPSDSIESRTLLASCVPDKEEEHKRRSDPDDWATPEEEALATAIHASAIAAVGGAFSPGEGDLHGSGRARDRLFDLAVVCGRSHAGCLDHFRRNRARLPRYPVLLVTRDANNNPVCPRTVRSITDAPEPTQGQPASFTNPQSNVRHVGYRQLFDWFIDGNSPTDIEDKLYEVL